MSYQDAIQLIGKKVENTRTHRLVVVRDIQPQRDGTHAAFLANGAIVPLDGIEKQWRAVEA